MVAALIAACAASPPSVRYGVDIQNKSSVAIRDVAVATGARTLHFRDKHAAMQGSAGVSGQADPIATAMTVTWQTEDGRSHAETIPVRLKGATSLTIRALLFRFTDAGIELYQAVELDEFSRAYTRIFPD